MNYYSCTNAVGYQINDLPVVSSLTAGQKKIMEEEEMLTLRAEREKYIQEAKVLTQIFKFSQILRKLKLSAFLLN